MSDAATEVIHLSIPSRLELLGLLDRVAMLICERAGFGEDACTQVTLAVIEAGTNAIQHGSRGEPDRAVGVDFSLWPDRLEVAVRDRGPGFDPALVSGDITSPEHLLDSRGRGIFIMRACMDAVDFRFDGSGTTCLLVKHRPTAS
jgi:anti-sigma regulatory factor (Ser/Thr protein kinase)